MLKQPISTLKISDEIRDELIKNGFMYTEDLTEDNKILQKHNINLEKLTKIKKPKSAFDLLSQELERKNITTFCKEIDEALYDGVSIGRITEFCGLYGSGKTQMCLQLCANVQIPKAYSGVQGRAIFIDTKSGFTIKRFDQISAACVEHCKTLSLSNNTPEVERELRRFNKRSISDRTFYIRALTKIDLIAIIKSLRTFLTKQLKVKLIIIDSISFLLKAEEDKLLRMQLIYEIMTELQLVADHFGIAIVVTNEMTYSSGFNELIPMLGNSYYHRLNYRVLFSKCGEGKFEATILKSLNSPVKKIQFVIGANGIRPD